MLRQNRLSKLEASIDEFSTYEELSEEKMTEMHEQVIEYQTLLGQQKQQHTLISNKDTMEKKLKTEKIHPDYAL
jgi:hypothetical protein